MTENEIREQINECAGIVIELHAAGAWFGWLLASSVLLGLRIAMLIRTRGRTSW